MKGWPKRDGNLILYFEMVLMSLFLIMNATDTPFQEAGVGNIVSQFVAPIFEGLFPETLHAIERTAWWIHITGILVFLKLSVLFQTFTHFISLPKYLFWKSKSKGTISKFGSSYQRSEIDDGSLRRSLCTPEEGAEEEVPEKFGASDVADLSWVQLLNSYTCTECGSCTSACPASLTGKELSPRNIMMKTRDRLEEVGRNIDLNKGTFVDDGKQLLNDYITQKSFGLVPVVMPAWKNVP